MTIFFCLLWILQNVYSFQLSASGGSFIPTGEPTLSPTVSPSLDPVSIIISTTHITSGYFTPFLEIGEVEFYYQGTLLLSSSIFTATASTESNSPALIIDGDTNSYFSTYLNGDANPRIVLNSITFVNFDTIIVYCHPSVNYDVLNGATISVSVASNIIYTNTLNGATYTHTFQIPISDLQLAAICSVYDSWTQGATCAVFNYNVTACSIIGVQCSSDGLVTSISVSGFGYSGTISSAIGSLAHLTSLDISQNSISGAVPETVCKLTNLKVLNLCGPTGSGCPLLRFIPSCFQQDFLQNKTFFSSSSLDSELMIVLNTSVISPLYGDGWPTLQVAEVVFLYQGVQVPSSNFVATAMTDNGIYPVSNVLDGNLNSFYFSFIGNNAPLPVLYIKALNRVQIDEIKVYNGGGPNNLDRLNGSMITVYAGSKVMLNSTLDGDLVVYDFTKQPELSTQPTMMPTSLGGAPTFPPATSIDLQLAAICDVFDSWTNQSTCAAKNYNVSACSINGTHCTSTGKVDSILVSGFGFHGTISSSIGNLASLTALDISSNSISGAVPDSICNIISIIVNINLCGVNGTTCPLLTFIPTCLATISTTTTGTSANATRYLGSLGTQPKITISTFRASTLYGDISPILNIGEVKFFQQGALIPSTSFSIVASSTDPSNPVSNIMDGSNSTYFSSLPSVDFNPTVTFLALVPMRFDSIVVYNRQDGSFLDRLYGAVLNVFAGTNFRYSVSFLDDSLVYTFRDPELTALCAVFDAWTHNSTCASKNYNVSACSVAGVHCSTATGLIDRIAVSGFGFSGTISSQIGSLSGLTYLDISSNSISGAVPSSLCYKYSLTYINFCGANGAGCPLLTFIPSCLLNSVSTGPSVVLTRYFGSLQPQPIVVINTYYTSAISNDSSPVLNIAEVQFFYQGTQVSRTSFSASASSALTGYSFSNAIDGNTTSFFSTDPSVDFNPSLSIHATVPVQYDSIKVYNRPDSRFYDRLNGAYLSVYADTQFKYSFSFNGANTIYSFQQPIDYQLAAICSVLDTWTHNSTCLSKNYAVTMCNITGVHCNSVGNIDSLMVSGRGYAGTISSSIGNLYSLTALDLSFNAISGIIPQEICYPTGLVYLNLCGVGGTGCPNMTFIPSCLLYSTSGRNITRYLGSLQQQTVITIASSTVSSLYGDVMPTISVAEVQFFYQGVQLPASSFAVSASSFNASNPAGLAMDGNPNTFYSSLPSTFPQLTISAVVPVQFTSIVVYNRQDGQFLDRLNGGFVNVGTGADIKYSRSFFGALSSYTFAVAVTDPGQFDPSAQAAAICTVFNPWTNGATCPSGNISTSSVCTISGITCASNGLVQSIVVPSFGYSGSISSAIGNLTGLTFLDLSGNILSGTVPPSICQLTNLVGLNLCGTKGAGCPYLTFIPSCLEDYPFNSMSTREFGLLQPQLYITISSTVFAPALGDTRPCLNIAEVVVFYQGQPLDSSKFLATSTSSVSGFPPSNVLDGSILTYFSSDCTADNSPSLTVTSAYSVKFDGLVIYNRQDAAQARIVGAQIDVLSGTHNVFHSTFSNSLSFFSFNDPNASAPQPELSAVCSLFDSWTGGATCAAKNYAVTVCNITGVHCASSGLVDSISILGRFFSGTIHSAIGSLGALTSLVLSQNSLTGDVPESLCSLTNLRRVDLCGNQSTGCPFLGFIPSCLVNAPNPPLVKLLSANKSIGSLGAQFRVSIQSSVISMAGDTFPCLNIAEVVLSYRGVALPSSLFSASSTSYTTGFAPSNVLDGNTNTYWTSYCNGDAAPQIYVNATQPVLVDTVTVYNRQDGLDFDRIIGATVTVARDLDVLFSGAFADNSTSFDFVFDTVQPTTAPSPSPSCSPTAVPTQPPSLSPSALPTVFPTPSPSLRPTTAPTVSPSQTPTAVPTLAPSRAPSAQPTVAPSRSPSVSPTPAPSAVPSQAPTVKVLSAPQINVLNSTASNSSVVVTVNVTASEGTDLYCNALSASANLSSIFLIRTGTPNSVPLGTTLAVVTLGGLSAVSSYKVYCYAESWSGAQMTLPAVSNTLTALTTLCCRLSSFTSVPSVIDPRDTSVAASLFTFQLSSLPSTTNSTASVSSSPLVNVNPIVSKVGDTSYIKVSPSAISFSASSASLSGSFFLSNLSSGSYVTTLNFSGPAGSQYFAPSVSFVILTLAAPVPAPVMSSAAFADSGGSVTLLFDKATNQAGITAASWACSQLLSFLSPTDSSSVCSWVNSSAVRILFPSEDQGRTLPVPGNTITLLGSLITAPCNANLTCLASLSASMLFSSSANPQSPVVNLNAPVLSSNCDDLLLDASSSYGSGSRSWSGIAWTVSTPTASLFGPNITAALPTVSKSLSQSILISKAFLFTPGPYIFSLSLTNFLGKTGSKAALVTIIQGTALPAINILGSNQLTVKAADTVSVTAKATPSSCDAAKVLTYTWKVFDASNVLQNITSTSRDPTVFLASPYTLSSNKQYIIQATATSQRGDAANAAVSAYVQNGAVVALIKGALSLTTAIDQALQLDASSSYDENSLVPNLSFAWTCSYLTTSNYGADCTSLLSVTNSSVLTIAAFALSHNQIYAISVTCRATDGRNSLATVSLTTTSAGSPVTSISYTVKAKYNVDDKLVFTGSIKSDSNTVAYWTVSNSGPPLSLASAAITPITNTFTVRGLVGIAYPLALASFSLSPGVTYTFQINAYVQGQPSLLSFASTTITINSPPSSGVLAILPTTGVALTDKFAISDTGYTDDPADFPLQYEFYYQIGGGNLVVISPKSLASFTSTTLPPGLASAGYNLSITSNIYDTWGASVGVSLVVTVSPFVVSNNVSITDILNSSLSSSSTDAAQTIQTCNVVASTLSSQNCLSVPNCTALNRESCDSQTLPNKCGSCLAGYTGVDGSSNIQCYYQSTTAVLQAAGGACIADADCLYHNCVANICVTPSKQCPDATCSGHGSCVYSDNAGNVISTCLLSDTYCSAACVCSGGYGGSDCNLSPAAKTEIDGSRTLICNSLLTSIAIQQPSTKLLESLATSLYLAFNPYEVTSTEGIIACNNLFNSITALVSEGYLSGASTQTIKTLTIVLSSFAKIASTFTATSASSVHQHLRLLVDSIALNVSAAANELTNGVLLDMTEGQSNVEITSDNFRFKAQASLLTDLHSSNLLPPIIGSGNVPYLVLPTAGLDACGTSGYLKTTVAQWVVPPYQNTSQLKSPLLRFSSLSESSSSANSSADNFFYIVLPFSSPAVLNATSGALVNNTVPLCVIRSGNTFTSCGCTVSALTTSNVTFVCDSVAVLCPSQAGRRLDTGTGISSQTASKSTVSEYGSFYKEVGNEFVNTLARDPVAPSIVVSALVGSLVGFILIGALIFYAWDRRDRVEIAKAVEATHERNTDPKKAELFRQESRASISTNRPKLQRRGSLRQAIEDNIFVRFVRVLSQEHKIIFPLRTMSISTTRLIRFLSFSKGLLVDLFWDTVLFGILYPSTNDCYRFTNQTNCLKEPSQFVGDTLCAWDGSQCNLADPPTDYLFIWLVAFMMTTLTMPCDIFLEHLMFEIGTKRPKLELIGLSSEFWLGKEIVDPDVEALVKELNDVDTEAQEIEKVRSILVKYSEEKLQSPEKKPNYYIESIMKLLKIRYRDGLLQVKPFSKLFHPPTVTLRIKELLEKSREDAVVIQRILNGYDDEIDKDLKMKTLVRYFILEFLQGRSKSSFRSSFLQLPRDIQEKAHPIPWLASWFCIWCVMAFCLYWIIQWGTLNGDSVVRAWGVNYAAGFVWSIIVHETVKIFITKVLYLELSRPRISNMYEKMKRHSNGGGPVNLVQLVSPACIAASFPFNNRLKAAVLLRDIDDRKASTICKNESICEALNPNKRRKSFEAWEMELHGDLAGREPESVDIILYKRESEENGRDNNELPSPDEERHAQIYPSPSMEVQQSEDNYIYHLNSSVDVQESADEFAPQRPRIVSTRQSALFDI